MLRPGIEPALGFEAWPQTPAYIQYRLTKIKILHIKLQDLYRWNQNRGFIPTAVRGQIQHA